MNSIDQRLNRLLRAAALAPPRPLPSALPFATENRVLARWRAGQSEGESFGAVRLFRRGFAVACALAAVMGLVSLTQTPDTETDFWTLSNATVNLAALP